MTNEPEHETKVKDVRPEPVITNTTSQGGGIWIIGFGQRDDASFVVEMKHSREPRKPVV
jgi:hypothetical protein